MAGIPKPRARRTRRRPCLRCDAVFASEGPHHRLCTTCREYLKLNPSPEPTYTIIRAIPGRHHE